MPVQDFECQIARNQIGRYLNGDGLSSEALRQLGSHVAECIGCKGFLDQRKAALQGMLGEAELPVRVEPEPEPEESMTPSESLIAQLKARSAFEEAQHKAAEKRAEREAAARSAAEQGVTADDFTVETGRGSHLSIGRRLITKPIMYGAALVVVLIGMSYLSKNSSAILGPKVETTTNRPAAHTAESPTISKAREGHSNRAPHADTSKVAAGTPPSLGGDSTSASLTDSDKTSADNSMSIPVDDSDAAKDLEQNMATGNDGVAATAPQTKPAKPSVVKKLVKSPTKLVIKHSVKPAVTPAAKPITARKLRRVARHGKVRRGAWRRHRFLGPKAGTGTIHIYDDGQ